jgi:hypoxanthine phosphoribosyltransferase
MYEITYIDGRQEILCKDKKEVAEHVSQIGNDGGLIQWITEQKAVINYYNTIVAYVVYVAPKSRVDFLPSFTEEALQTLANDEVRELLKDYSWYVDAHIENETYKEIESLLYFMSFVWVNKK